jgi:3-phenylpropionate/trans-cinnamate dioxygenase ferredoxin subunit
VDQAARSYVVANAADLAPGAIKRVEVDGRGIALFNVDGTFYAVNDSCTHMRARLSDGYVVEGGIVECPLHFGKFDIRTGKAMSAPCTVAVRIYPVARDGDLISVLFPPG